MIRKYIIEADDSIKGFDEEIARLEREWGAEEIEPCVSEGVCREDEIQVLDKIKADLIKLKHDVDITMYGIAIDDVLEIIDKYKAESEEQPKTGDWIPVSERLPEKDEWVLITFDNDIEIALLDDDGWCYSSVGDDDWIAEHPPVAWMPLPEPYKAESEEQ